MKVNNPSGRPLDNVPDRMFDCLVCKNFKYAEWVKPESSLDRIGLANYIKCQRAGFLMKQKEITTVSGEKEFPIDWTKVYCNGYEE